MAAVNTRVKKKVKTARYKRDPKKEALLKELSQIITDAGYTVRREKLKQGHGWRVLSGCCRAEENRMIFVDRRLSLDDQLAFLVSRITALNIQVDLSRLKKFPTALVGHLLERAQATAAE
ncbi:MAG: hypothetical protein D6719_03970 [Candidatus Dadabacteria bacterium]|nr:MAG: hypothetical protein D6719_03970 [Candidatus Dadabacteria bacterium]